MITIIPALVALVGLLIYLLASNGKAQRVGEILFFVGAFFTVGGLTSHTVKLF